jgi:hypothetical protein
MNAGLPAIPIAMARSTARALRASMRRALTLRNGHGNTLFKRGCDVVKNETYGEKNMTNAISRFTQSGNFTKQRLHVKTFKHRDDMHKFLNTGDNALHWTELCELHGIPMKAGIYAYAGGKWHNVKTLDPVALAHI